MLRKIKHQAHFPVEITELHSLEKEKIFASMSMWKEVGASKYNFKMISIKADSCFIVNSYAAFGFDTNENGNPIWSQVTQNDTETLFTPLLSDYIYSLNIKGEQTVRYIFKGDMKPVDSYPQRSRFKNYMDAVKVLKTEGYDTGIRDLYVTNTYLLFDFPSEKSNKYYHILWNMDKNKGSYTEFPVIPYPVRRIRNIFSTYKNKFVTAFTADEVIAFQKGKYAEYGIKDHKQLDEIAEILTEEDNPIIVLYELEYFFMFLGVFSFCLNSFGTNCPSQTILSAPPPLFYSIPSSAKLR